MARHVFYLNPAKDVEFSFSGTADAARRKMREHMRRHHNVEMGFYDRKGTFHPIRASSDYSSGRAGEGRKKKKARKRRR
jgi:hypothetical protein